MRKIVSQIAAMIAAVGLLGTMALPAYAAITPNTSAANIRSGAPGDLPPQTLAVEGTTAQSPIARDDFTVTSAAVKSKPTAAARVPLATTAASTATAAVTQAQAAHAARSAQLLHPVAPNPVYSGAAVIAYGNQFVGVVPYGSGNSPATSFSCDGFVQYVFAGFGKVLPRGADHQAALGVQIAADAAVAGDLVWWPGQHIGIYDGAGGMVNSPVWGRFVEHPNKLWGNPTYIRLT